MSLINMTKEDSSALPGYALWIHFEVKKKRRRRNTTAEVKFAKENNKVDKIIICIVISCLNANALYEIMLLMRSIKKYR